MSSSTNTSCLRPLRPKLIFSSATKVYSRYLYWFLKLLVSNWDRSKFGLLIRFKFLRRLLYERVGYRKADFSDFWFDSDLAASTANFKYNSSVPILSKKNSDWGAVWIIWWKSEFGKSKNSRVQPLTSIWFFSGTSPNFLDYQG